MLVAGRRPEMMADLRGTRFAVPSATVSGGMRFIERVNLKAAAKPSADDSDTPTVQPQAGGQAPQPPVTESQRVPVQVRRQAPAPVQPASAPQQPTDSTAATQLRFIDRLRQVNR
jgi:hypothetical protein